MERNNNHRVKETNNSENIEKFHKNSLRESKNNYVAKNESLETKAEIRNIKVFNFNYLPISPQFLQMLPFLGCFCF